MDAKLKGAAIVATVGTAFWAGLAWWMFGALSGLAAALMIWPFAFFGTLIIIGGAVPGGEEHA